MRIEIDGQVIAGRTPKESVSGFNLAGGPIIQKSLPLRATRPTWRNRGNTTLQTSFTVTREHASIAEAAVFAYEHEEGLMYVGKIQISEDYDGKKILKEGDGCIRQLAGCTIRGVTTILRYDLETGPMTKPKATV